jgi:hypothetical protein
VTQESVRLGRTGYDVEVEIARKEDVRVDRKNGKELFSVGIRQYAPLPPMRAKDLLVVFDLGTVLDIDQIGFSAPESGSRLPVESTGPGNVGPGNVGPIRVPAVLKEGSRVSLQLCAEERPFGTLTVTIHDDGTLGGGTFSPPGDAM